MKFLVLFALLGLAIGDESTWADDAGAVGASSDDWPEPPSGGAAGASEPVKDEWATDEEPNYHHHCAEGEHQEDHCEWDDETWEENCYESCVSGCGGFRRDIWNQDEQVEEILCFEGEFRTVHDGCVDGTMTTWAQNQSDQGEEICLDAHDKPDCPAGKRSEWGPGHEICVDAGTKMDCSGYKMHRCDHKGCAEFCNTEDDSHRQRVQHDEEGNLMMSRICQDDGEQDDGEQEMWKDGERYCVHYEACGEGQTAVHGEQVTCHGADGTVCEHWRGRVCVRSHEHPRCGPGKVRTWDHEKQMEFCADVGQKICEGGFRSWHCDEDGCSEYCIMHAVKQEQHRRDVPEEGCSWEDGEEQWDEMLEGDDGEWHHHEFCVHFSPCPAGEVGVHGGRQETDAWWNGKICVSSSDHPTCPEGTRREWDHDMQEDRCVQTGHAMVCDGFKTHSCDHTGCHNYCIHDAHVPERTHSEEPHECDWEADPGCWECDWSRDGMEMECNHEGCVCVIYNRCEEHQAEAWAERPDGSHGRICVVGTKKPGCHEGSVQEWDHHNQREVCLGNGRVLERREADTREYCNAKHSDLGAGNDSCCTVEFKCGHDEGDCDSDDQCHDGLVCGAPCSWNYDDMEGGADQCCGYPKDPTLEDQVADDFERAEEKALEDLREDEMDADMTHRDALHELADWYMALSEEDHMAWRNLEMQAMNPEDGSMDFEKMMEMIAAHFGLEGVKKDALIRFGAHLQDEMNVIRFEEKMGEGHAMGHDEHGALHHAVDDVADHWEEAERAALEDLKEDAMHTDMTHREALKELAEWYMNLSEEDHSAIEQVTMEAESFQHAFELIADHFGFEGIKREALMKLGQHLEEEMTSGSSRFEDHMNEHGLDYAVHDVANQWEGKSGCDEHHHDLGHGNDSCCSEEHPCAENEGDCDADHDCQEGLVCGAPCSWNHEGMEGGADQCCGLPW